MSTDPIFLVDENVGGGFSSFLRVLQLLGQVGPKPRPPLSITVSAARMWTGSRVLAAEPVIVHGSDGRAFRSPAVRCLRQASVATMLVSLCSSPSVLEGGGTSDLRLPACRTDF
ncbi:hypothetical protein H920_18944 [Fukomys damarensis]|uniref:Uncharacterized protein n=1 Tax=Fukomys damarensis TaxID=885580 RepID=A0A091CPS2_FUKDA|nr:hypothetical protein H920_18944 [Fukomys damarensis]